MRRIILIGNYTKDRQESMERFALLLHSGLKKTGVAVLLIRPKIVFGLPASSTTQGWGKWLGYVDKWLLFPIRLKYITLREDKNTHFHICDHSNAPYLAHLPRERRSITCHDVLAIQGALGDASAYCKASRFGVILQKWILSNLRKATKLASVSETTMKALQDLTDANRAGRNWEVIHNGFNATFYRMEAIRARQLLGQAGLPVDKPFLLHLGSDLPRKNRQLLVDMLEELAPKWDGIVCFAGQAAGSELRKRIDSSSEKERVVFLEKPNQETLCALFTCCEAFVFPSYSEGFGWPVIEAQACGAPVIASDCQPMPEVTNGSGMHASPKAPREFAEALIRLKKDPALRQTLIEAGYENCKRFEPDMMIKKYVDLIFGDI